MSSNTVVGDPSFQESTHQRWLPTYWVAAFFAAVLTFCLIDSARADETVNINTADIVTLAEGLSGVGPQLARRIVEFRERYGDFETVEALKDVQGIGDALLVRNLNKIVLK